MNFGMSEAEFRKLVADEAAPLGGTYTLRYDATARFLPVLATPGSAGQVIVAAAMVFAWEDTTSPSKKKVHNFVVAFDPYENQWAFWCGDKWLEGRADDQSARRDRALEYLGTKGLRVGPALRLHDGAGFNPSTPCNFFKNGNNCKHRNGVFHHIKTKIGIDAFIAGVQSQAAPLTGGAPVAAAPEPVPTSDPMLAKLSRYAFSRNVVLEGDKGWGKTWLVTKFAADPTADVQKVVYIGGHEGLESVDLIGHMIKAADGSLAWKDGKLSEAFRCASAGIKTLVLFDEVLRVRKRELSVLVGALAPHADGKLHLSTGRAINVIDGIAEEEVLTCERSDLWVVGTTNVGAGYEVDDMEEALSDRFPIVLRIEGGSAMLKSKLGPVIADRGFSSSLLPKFVKLFDGFQTGRTNSYVTRQINLRHLCEVVESAVTEGEILELVRDRIPQWVERDVNGGMLTAQLDFVNELINEAFSAKGRK